jgi:hypothetical protein
MAPVLAILSRLPFSRRACIKVLEANMTVTNVIEVLVALAVIYAAYRFFQKRA